MEKLTHLKVSGFRSLREVDVELRDLTVLIGANGSGKSNFVALFNMLQFMLAGDLQLYVARRGGASSILHYGPKVTEALEAKLTLGNAQHRLQYCFSLSLAAPDRLVIVKETLERLESDGTGPNISFSGSGSMETGIADFATQPDEWVTTTYARAFADWFKGSRVYHFHDTSETASFRGSQDLDRNQTLLNTGGNLASFLYMLRQRYPQHFERILTTVRLVVPYLRDFVLTPDAINPTRIQLRWRDRNPDYEFGPHQLSDGSLRAIALVTALLQPEELMPSAIIVDEPELGLHPSAVATIAQLLKGAASKRQVIVATQSPKLVSAFAPEQVVVVEREEEDNGNGYTTLRNLSKEQLGSWLDDYDLGQLYDMNVTGGGPQ